jgi:hypothetical protein
MINTYRIAISGNKILPAFCLSKGSVGCNDTTRGFQIDSPATAKLKIPSSREREFCVTLNMVRQGDRQTDKTVITMKFKTLTMSIMLSTLTIGAFASSFVAHHSEPLPFHKVKVAKGLETIVSKPLKSTCTVTVKFGKISTTVTASCECTQREACAAAYQLATML